MAQAPSGGMDKNALKPLLMKSKKDPVNCAVGMDGQVAVMTLNKIKQPRALVKELEGGCKDLKNPRFGTAFVDTDVDSKLVILTLNKPAPGMGNKLRKALKGTGISKVRIMLEDGTVAEDVSEEEEESEGGGQAAAAPGAPPEEPVVGPAAAPAEEPQAAAPFAAPNASALGKSKLIWVAARKRVEDEIGKLHKEMTKHYDGHGFSADLDKVFQSKIEPMMQSLDESLAHKLDEVTKNTDAAAHSKLVGEARQIISKYESFLASEPLIKQLDSNPFVPLAIQKTLTATLAALSKSVN